MLPLPKGPLPWRRTLPYGFRGGWATGKRSPGTNPEHPVHHPEAGVCVCWWVCPRAQSCWSGALLSTKRMVSARLVSQEMFEFLKSVFKKAGPPPSPAQSAPVRPAPAPAAAPLNLNPKLTSTPSPSVPSTPDTVEIPFDSLLPRLPETVRHKFASKPKAAIRLPLEFVLPQLAKGKIQISLSDLRRYSTPGTILGNDGDQSMIELPLS